jgi:hypothetical protein
MSELDHSSKAFQALIATADLPALGPAPRMSRLLLDDLTQRVKRFVTNAKSPPELIPCLRSAALLWHDYLDESHAISQNIHTADGSFLHAIMHRREPDYANAKYWFHRAGRHSCFSPLADETTRFLASTGENQLSAQLAPSGSWDPFAFVDACEEAANHSSSNNRVQTLMAVQRIEFDCLLAALFRKYSTSR